MAKIVPQGYANINAYDEGDNFFKLLEYIDRYGSRVDARREQKENNNIAGLDLLTGLTQNAVNSTDIENIKNIYKNTIDTNYVSSNPQYNAAVDIFDLQLENKSTRINEMETSSQEFANNLYSTNNVFNTNILNMDDTQLVKMFTDMNKDEISGWIKTAISEREKISLYSSNMFDLYGDKNPNFKINVNGQMRSLNQMNLDLRRYSDTIDALTMKALDDDVLSREEAKLLMMISPSQGVGLTQFNEMVKNKRDIAKNIYEEGKGLIFNKSLSVAKNILSSQNTPLSGMDAASLLEGIVSDDTTKGAAAAAIPSMEQMQFEDENGNVIQFKAITNSMSDDEKIQAFKDRILVEGGVAPNVLSAYFSNIISQGESQIERANRIWDAFGGREDYFGLGESTSAASESETFIKYTYGNTDNQDEGTPKLSTQDLSSEVENMQQVMKNTIKDVKEEVDDSTLPAFDMKDSEVLQAKDPVKDVKRDIVMYEGRKHEVDSNGRVKAGMFDENNTYSWTGQIRRVEPKKYIEQTMDKEGTLTFNNLNDFLSNFDLTKSEFSEKERALINRIAKESDTPENRKSGKSLLRKYLISEKFPGSFRGEKGFPSGGKSSIFSAIKQLKKYYSVGENRKQDYSSYQALKGQIPLLKELLGLDYDLTSNQKLASMMSKHSDAKTINDLELGFRRALPGFDRGYVDEK
jgi:hypothetical protein